MRLYKLLLVMACLAIAVIPVLAQQVVRGPYLQIGSSSSIIVRWRTDVATDSRVRYGTSQGSLIDAAEDTRQTKEHELTLAGLSANTMYYYSIGTSSTSLAGGDAAHFFVTSPSSGSGKPTRIWILGDSGTANSSSRAVRDAYYDFTGSRHTDLWLMLGDNAYSKGKDEEYQAAVFENMYEKMLRKSVLWPTLGNHDDGASSTPGPYPYYDIFSLPKNGEAGGLASGTEAYYSFDYGDIHFICLNSATNDLRSSSSAMWVWLEEDIAANDKSWTIAFWHHPPYTKGSHDSDSDSELKEMRARAVPLLEEGGVDLVLSGHSHSYERSFLVDSHYGKSGSLSNDMIIDAGDGRDDGDGSYRKGTLGPGAHEGSIYLVNGSSGKTSGGSLDHPIMVHSYKELGSVVLDIDGNRLDATFINDKGVRRDYFSIIKGATNVGPPDRLAEIAGNNQTDNVGQTLALPFVVQVKDASGNPVPGVAVTFELATGNAGLSNSQPRITSSSGRATTTLTLGSEPGEYVVTASASGLAGSPIKFVATAVGQNAGAPAPPTNVRVVVFSD